MRRAALLLVYSLKRVRTMVITTGLLLAALQLVLIFVAGALHTTGAFEQLSTLLPPFARELLGPSFAVVLSFSGIVCMGYFEVAVMGALIALAVTLGTVPASEVETGFMDLILARPLARRRTMNAASIRSYNRGLLFPVARKVIAPCAQWRQSKSI